MRIALKTFRDELKQIVNNSILKEMGIEVDCIVDVNASLWGTNYKNIDIVSPFEAFKRYKSEKFDKLVLPGATVGRKILGDYFEEAMGFGYLQEDILYSSVELFWSDKSQNPFLSHDEYTYLDYLEFHTNDHCNLNCKHCNNYSNYVKKEVFTDFGNFVGDITQLKKIVSHIHRIRVLGGEPLLNEETPLFIEKVREIYPYADIHLVTNGTLLGRMNEKWITILKKTNTLVEISAYPPMFDKIDEIAVQLKEWGLKFKIGWIALGFRPPIIHDYHYPLTKVDCNCVHLRNGKLARCPLVQYLDYYNEANRTNWSGKDGIIDIYEKDLTFHKLYERLSMPFDLCNRCGFWRSDLPAEAWTNH